MRGPHKYPIYTGASCFPNPTLEELREFHMKYMKRLFKAMEEDERATEEQDKRKAVYYSEGTK